MIKLRSIDVLMGRGGGTNNYSGNIVFRHLVAGHRQAYQTANIAGKSAIRDRVVAAVAESGGRFLMETTQQDGTIVHLHVGERIIKRKVSQALRERDKTKDQASCAAQSTVMVVPLTAKPTPTAIPKPRHNRMTRAATRASQDTIVADDFATSRRDAKEESLSQRQSSPFKATSTRKHECHLIVMSPRKKRKLRSTENMGIDVLGLVSMPLVPSPPQMWCTPPLPIEAVPTEHIDTFRYGYPEDSPENIPAGRILTERKTHAMSRESYPGFSDSESCKTSKSSADCLTMAPGPHSILPPPTPYSTPNSMPPESCASEGGSSILVDVADSQETTSIFQLIQPKETFIAPWKGEGFFGRASPKRRLLVEVTSTHADQETMTVPALWCQSLLGDAKNEARKLLTESFRTRFLPVGPATARRSLPSSAMERLSMREESPAPMRMFASTFPPTGENMISRGYWYPAQVTTSWWGSQPSLSASAFQPLVQTLQQGKGTPSRLLESAPNRISRRDHDSIDPTLQEAKTSRVLEFDDHRLSASTGSERCMLSRGSPEEAGYCQFQDRKPILSMIENLNKNRLDRNVVGYPARRVSDVTGLSSNAESAETAALPSPTRRVSLY